MTEDLFYENDLRPLAVGTRLMVLRTMSGLKQKYFAERCGIPNSQYNAMEKGNERPGIERATTICVEFGVTLDFIYRGLTGTLRSDIANTLRQIRRNQLEFDNVRKLQNISKTVAPKDGGKDDLLRKKLRRLPKH